MYILYGTACAKCAKCPDLTTFSGHSEKIVPDDG
jgi:hypothetical protein